MGAHFSRGYVLFNGLFGFILLVFFLVEISNASLVPHLIGKVNMSEEFIRLKWGECTVFLSGHKSFDPGKVIFCPLHFYVLSPVS